MFFQDSIKDEPQISVSIPKIINFLWIGREKILPPPNMEVMLNWLKKHPGYRILLWFGHDLDETKEDADRFRLEYIEKLREAGFAEEHLLCLELHHIGELLPIFDNVDKFGAYANCIRYEMRALRPNYGAASDLLRYIIIYVYGGGYFDTDVAVGADNLDPICNILYTCSVILSDHLSQTPNPKVLLFEKFAIDDEKNDVGISADSIVVSPLNPCMLQIAKAAGLNYDFEASDICLKTAQSTGNLLCLTNTDVALADIFHVGIQNIHPILRRIYFAYGKCDMLNSTLLRTGPELFRSELKKIFADAKCDDSEGIKQIKTDYSGQHLILMPLRSDVFKFCQPLENDLLWLQIGVARSPSLDQAVQRAINTLKFELQFGIIRLDEHIDEIMQSINMGLKKLSVAEITSAFISALEKEQLDYSKVQVAQQLYKRQEVLAFYSSHKMLNKDCCNLFTDIFPSVINLLANRYIFSSVYKYLQVEVDCPLKQQQMLDMVKILDRTLRVISSKIQFDFTSITDMDCKQKTIFEQNMGFLFDFIGELSIVAEYINPLIYNQTQRLDLNRFTEVRALWEECRTDGNARCEELTASLAPSPALS